MNRHPAFAMFTLGALILMLALGVAIHPAAAQATDPTVNLTASTTKAKIGSFVEYRVLLENSGADTIPAVAVNLGLPDALDARAVNCPGDSHGNVTYCELGDVAPGTIVEVLFYVEVGAKEPNGPVTASVSSGGTVLATDELAPLKIVGPRR